MIKEAILKLAKKEDLTYQEAEAVMNEIMSGGATPVQMASYLTALSLKGETIDEITASAAGMRAHCVKLLHDMDVLEIVGTGGDGSNSFNISTTASMVIAAGGVPVAKHGNRAASSKSGAADVLEALGVKITISPEKSAELLKKINICFLFAQNYHIAMKYVAPIRKELGIRTVFNILGPLSNPAGANMELMGVFDDTLVEPLAQVMMKLGVKRGMVVYGQDSLDEISMCAPTSVCEIRDGWFQSYELTPEQFGYTRCGKEELKGGLPEENAAITRAVLDGSDRGAKRCAVCLNAGAALYIAGKTETMEQGVRMAERLIDSGGRDRWPDSAGCALRGERGIRFGLPAVRPGSDFPDCSDFGGKDYRDCERSRRLCLLCLLSGRHGNENGDYHGRGSHGEAGEAGKEYSLRGRLWSLHAGAGKGDGGLL